jgi:hypothetical protein
MVLKREPVRGDGPGETGDKWAGPLRVAVYLSVVPLVSVKLPVRLLPLSVPVLRDR